MNETINSILSRRSTREFDDKTVDEGLMKAIIEAGSFAPSGLNKQPWYFTVIENKELIKKLNVDTKAVIGKTKLENYKAIDNEAKDDIFYGAPVVVLVSRDTLLPHSAIDCAVASENMLIAAESLGISSCWTGTVGLLFHFDEEKGKQYQIELGLPENYMVSHALVFGYGKKAKAVAAKRKDDFVKYIR